MTATSRPTNEDGSLASKGGNDALPTRFLADPWLWKNGAIRLRVWWYIWHYRDWRTDQGTYRGIRRMGKDLGYSRSRIHEILNELEDAGRIRSESRGSGRAKVRFAVWPNGVRKPSRSTAKVGYRPVYGVDGSDGPSGNGRGPSGSGADTPSGLGADRSNLLPNLQRAREDNSSQGEPLRDPAKLAEIRERAKLGEL
jgi:hypothetical protein